MLAAVMSAHAAVTLGEMVVAVMAVRRQVAARRRRAILT